MTRTTYSITTKHSNGYRDGVHEVNVTTDNKGLKSVSGGGFGCSRDYATDKDITAIKFLIAENGMTLVKSKKLKSVTY